MISVGFDIQRVIDGESTRNFAINASYELCRKIRNNIEDELFDVLWGNVSGKIRDSL